MDSWETEITAKLGDLGGIFNGIVSGDVGTSDACVNQNRSRNARFGATFDTDLKPASTDDTCFDSTPRVGRTLLVHLARVQRVRTCFEDAVQRVQERWQGRLSQMGEIFAVRVDKRRKYCPRPFAMLTVPSWMPPVTVA